MWDSFTYYGLLAIESVAGAFGVRLYEEPLYRVVGQVGTTIEVRQYVPRVAAEATIPGTGDKARGEAFQVLFNYIAGANKGGSGGEKISMTAPVSVTEPQRIAMTAPVSTSEAGGSVRMRFFLPATFTVQSAPQPHDQRIRIVEVPAETQAVLRFSGTGTDMPDRQRELVAGLAGSRWRAEGQPFAMFYDAPFTLPFLRRNEAAVVVAPVSG